MAKLEYYGIIAVKYSADKIHHHYISHAYVIEKKETGYSFPGTLYTKAQVIQLMAQTNFYTLTWNYSTGLWSKGAKVDTEVVGGITYLRTTPDKTVKDNLSTIIDYDFFKCQ